MPDLLKAGMVAMLDCSQPLPMDLFQLIHVQSTTVVTVLLNPTKSVMMVPPMPMSLMLAVLTARLLDAEMVLLTLVKSVMENNSVRAFAQLLSWDT
jgi:hypothetical protein